MLLLFVLAGWFQVGVTPDIPKTSLFMAYPRLPVIFGENNIPFLPELLTFVSQEKEDAHSPIPNFLIEVSLPSTCDKYNAEM